MSYNGIIFNSKKIINVEKMKEVDTELSEMSEVESRQNYLPKNQRKIFSDKFNAKNFSKKSNFYSYYSKNSCLDREAEGKSSSKTSGFYCYKSNVLDPRAKYKNLMDGNGYYLRSSCDGGKEDIPGHSLNFDVKAGNYHRLLKKNYEYETRSYDGLSVSPLDEEIERCLNLDCKLNSSYSKDGKPVSSHSYELDFNNLIDFSHAAPRNGSAIHLERFLSNNIYSLNNTNTFSGLDSSYFIIAAIIAKHIGFRNRNLVSPSLFRSCLLFLPRTLLLAYVLLKRYLGVKKIENMDDLRDLFFICCVVSYKVQADYNVMNQHLVQDKGFSLCKINYLEALLLNSIDYNISTDEEEFRGAIREISVLSSYL